MKFKPNKFMLNQMESMVVSRSRTIASRYDDLTLCGAELEEAKNLQILEVTLDSKLRFETHLRVVVLKAAKRLRFVGLAEKLFDCPRVLKSFFNSYILSSLEYCASVWMSSRSLICVCWIVLFAAQKSCVRMTFVVCLTERRSVLCVCTMTFITEWTTL